MAALEKRCQLASSSKVSVSQLYALGDIINLTVPDMETFIDQLNDAGTSLTVCQILCMHQCHPSCQHSGYRAYAFTRSLAHVQQQSECTHGTLQETFIRLHVCALQVSSSKRGGACMRFLQPSQNWRLSQMSSHHKAPQTMGPSSHAAARFSLVQ